MEVRKELSRQPPSWIRFLQVGLGVIAIGLALSAIVFPSVGVATVSVVLAAALIVIGIERIVTVFSPNRSKSSRVGNIILGALVVGLGATVLAFPLYATGFLVILLSIGLLFAGIARVIQGSTSKNVSKTSRGLAIGVGILAIAISCIVFAAPLLGVVFLNFVVAIALLIIGIECIAQAISGRRLITSRSITP
ncbi:MAG: HdeD family acid-resistance protein [Nitrososphaeraceae archaeon]|jgi:uncharacterized membrane protein HdeD (DUF308 family)